MMRSLGPKLAPLDGAEAAAPPDADDAVAVEGVGERMGDVEDVGDDDDGEVVDQGGGGECCCCC